MDNVNLRINEFPFIGNVEVQEGICAHCGSCHGYNLVITIPFERSPDYFMATLGNKREVE